MRPLGAFSSVVSYWASYSLTRNAAEDRALFLLPRNKQGQKEREEKNGYDKRKRYEGVDPTHLPFMVVGF